MLFTIAENSTGCDSQLSINNNYAMKQLLLNAISLKVILIEVSCGAFYVNDQMCATHESLMSLLSKTLLALQADRLNVNLENLLDECLQYLIDMKIVRINEEGQGSHEGNSGRMKKLTYETTKLGKATVEG